MTSSLDATCINTLRFLAVDAVERAKSGHPGMPLGAAPMAYVLWDRFLRHNPHNPAWFNRDRFVLSAGHGSALLYALLHTTGYDLPLEEIKRFRQWGSRTAGHPERGLAPGVEATTGPLGQGFAMGVGMAVAERFLAACFNRSGFNLIDHFTYAITSDGDMMEGVSSEAASLAGTLGLGRLVYLYDCNGISIEGPTDITFREDVGARFTAYGWQVLKVEDGNDLEALGRAIGSAREETSRPSLIVVRTHIGFGSPGQDTAQVHGEPLGPEGARATKQALGWPVRPDFVVPEEALEHMRLAVGRGRALEQEWTALLERYRREWPDAARAFELAAAGTLPGGWERSLPTFDGAAGAVSTRAASGDVLNALAGAIPTLFGGSADLAPSTRTLIRASADQSAATPEGRNIHFGVREHAMGCIVNGMALHGGAVAFGSTFLVFSDYMRPALRFAALMQCPATFVFTHDSIALGEDGPTHQPVEHLMSLRAMPGMTVLRPADANETAACWRLVLERRRPAALVLARQTVPVLDPSKFPTGEASRGAYAVREAVGPATRKRGPAAMEAGLSAKPVKPDVILIATGSEVHLALAAVPLLEAQGLKVRVVSMPSWEIFEEQPEEYRRALLPSGVPKLAIEAGSTLGWRRYVGDRGAVLGLDRFGASAPGPIAYKNLGFTAERVAAEALRIAKRRGT